MPYLVFGAAMKHHLRTRNLKREIKQKKQASHSEIFDKIKSRKVAPRILFANPAYNKNVRV